MIKCKQAMEDSACGKDCCCLECEEKENCKDVCSDLSPNCEDAVTYADPTAFYGTKQIVKEEAETERRANELIKVLKFIIRSCGFELIERVKIKDTKTGKEFK